MTPMQIPGLFSVPDYLALGLLLLAWMGIGLAVENPPRGHPSTTVIMASYRREWMVHFLTRDPRIFDSQIIANLRQGTAFFASASMIALGGGLALVGNADLLRGLAVELTLEAAPTVVWEIKIVVMLSFAANAFLKFVWANRLFGYCTVLMAAVPNDPTDPVARPRAEKVGEINVTAARSFNRGLRAVYFGIASAAWLLGSVALIVATLLTLSVVWRREFWSRSRAVLLAQTDGMTYTHT